MTFGQLHRTVILIAACLIAAALASVWALSSSRPPDRPVVVQVITYRQEAARFDERWGELLKQLLSPRPSEPVQMALADIPPKQESLPREHLDLVREQITAAVAVTATPHDSHPAWAHSSARSPQRARKAHITDICRGKGRRYYKKGRGMAWRCIR